MPAKLSTLDDVLTLIQRSDRLLVTAHARPDGDAVGSVLACWMILQQMDKNAEMALSDRVPPIYRSLPCWSRIHQWHTIEGKYDAIILLECDSVERAGIDGLENYFLINIDHHTSGRPFGHVNWIDTGACAVAEMVYRLGCSAGVRITPEIATCLYTAVLTDTGSFCYDGTDDRTFNLAGDLVRHGANPALVAQNVYFSNPPSKMRLLGAALSNLHCNGSIAWLWINNQDMTRLDAKEEDCEGIVNYAISIAGINVALFLRELPDQRVRLSLRSKGQLNVALVAERFGGGGHENASGCTLDGPLALALERLLRHLRNEVPTVSA